MPKRKNREYEEDVPQAKKARTAELRSQILRDGVQAKVQVNQRALIDKMLARYAGSYSTFRELIQNADDAGARNVTIEFFSSVSSVDTISSVSEIRLRNDGRPFVENDWERVSKIAEGNPDEQTVGMFGVGFYSVFSFTEHPLIYSDGHWLAFHWDGDQLCTSRMTNETLHAQNEYSDLARFTGTDTMFLFTIRDKKLSFSVEDLSKFLQTAMYFSKSLRSIKLLLNDNEICTVKKTVNEEPNEIQITSETKQLKLTEEVLCNLLPSLKKADAAGVRNRLSMTIEQLTSVQMSIETTITKKAEKQSKIESFIVVEASCTPKATAEFQKQCHRILKKNIPATTRCSLLFQPKGNSLTIGKIFVGISTHQRTGSLLHLSGHFYPTIERENIDFRDTYLGHWNSLLLFSLGCCGRLFYRKCLKQRDFNYGGFNNPQELASVFCFGSSTPQELISQTFAAGFFFSSESPAIQSNRGIKPSIDTFKCDSAVLEFLRALKVAVPDFKYQQDKSTKGFFQQLVQRKLISPLPLSVIEAGLDKAVLSTAQFTALVSWVLQKISNTVSEKKVYRDLLKHATYREDSVCKKKNYKKVTKFATFSNLPVPPTVLSDKIIKSFSAKTLKEELKLKEYTIENWITEFLRVTKGEDSFLIQYALHEEFAPVILSFFSSHVIPSKQEAKIIAKLKTLTCIPCKRHPSDNSALIMKVPSQTAIESCWIPEDKKKIFVADLQIAEKVAKEEMSDDDDVIMELSDLSSDQPEIFDLTDDVDDTDDTMVDISAHGITKEFLKKIGVRVAPPASVILSNLATGKDHEKDHIAVIENLYQERKDFRDEDWVKIRQSKFLNCYSLSDPSMKSIEAPNDCVLSIKHIKTQTAITDLECELWEQTMMKLTKGKVVCFTEPPSYEIVSFMDQTLHIRAFPHPSDLLKSCRTLNEQDYFLGIRFLFTFYSQYKELLEKHQRQKTTPIYMADSGKFYGAKYLYAQANKFRAVIHPKIIELALEMEIELKYFGVQTQPPIEEILEMLKTDPSRYITMENAKDMLEYLYEAKITSNEMRKLRTLEFVPTPQGTYQRACEVMVPSMNSDGDEEEIWDELFSYIDFGPIANEFLISCGAKSSPSGKDFANKFINGKSCLKYFKSHSFNPKRYLKCLRELAKYLDSLTKTVLSKLNNIETLLAVTPDNAWQLCNPKECNLIDNTAWQDIVKPLSAPVETDELLVKLYSTLGCRWLSSEVNEKSEPLGKATETPRSKKLQNLIAEIYPLFLHKKNGTPLDYIAKDAHKVLPQLRVMEVQGIKRILIYRGNSHHLKNSEELSMCTLSKNVLYLHKQSKINFFDIGHTLSQIITRSHSPAEERGTVIAQLLQTPLSALSSRGWAVNRVLGLSKNQTQTFDMEIIELDSDSDGAGPVLISDFFENQQNTNSLLSNVVQQSSTKTPAVVRRSSQKKVHASNEAPDCSIDADYKLDNKLKKKHGIMLYRYQDSLSESLPGEWLEAHHSFVALLKKIVGCIPGLNISACKVFLDENTNQIAFNYNCTLFFNLRYYYQVHYEPKCGEQEAAISWFVTLCHEVAHNKESEHNKEHEHTMESLISGYMGNLLALYRSNQ